MKEIKEFKTTCLACGKVTFRPYVDFEAIEKDARENKGKNLAKGLALSGAITAACPPLGCCMALGTTADTLKQADRPMDERIKTYCESYICKACNSTALKTEVITHHVE